MQTGQLSPSLPDSCWISYKTQTFLLAPILFHTIQCFATDNRSSPVHERVGFRAESLIQRSQNPGPRAKSCPPGDFIWLLAWDSLTILAQAIHWQEINTVPHQYLLGFCSRTSHRYRGHHLTPLKNEKKCQNSIYLCIVETYCSPSSWN